MTNLKIDVHHVTRVEGHGNIVVNAKNGVLEECRLDIVETPRFFEAMLRGRPYTEASHITSRICGICAVGHATASLRATGERAGRRVVGADVALAQADLSSARCWTATFCTPTCSSRPIFQRRQRHSARGHRAGRGPARAAA